MVRGLLRNDGRDDICIIDENLNPVVVIISHINKVPSAVHRNPFGIAKLAVAAAKTTPLCQIVAVAIKLLNAVVVCVSHIHIIAAVHRNTFGATELAVTAAITAPLRQIVAIAGEFLNAVVA